MATSTFERKIEIRDTKSLKKLMCVMTDDTVPKSLSKNPFSTGERKRSEKLLKQFLSRSGH